MTEIIPLVETKNCTMEFPGVRALDNVNFKLLPGECHALVGENGAGKSTLAKCIIGEYRMTSGDLYICGERINPVSYNVRVSQNKGIAVVHQEFQLMSDMTGIENIFIGHYSTKGPLIDWKKLRNRAEDLMSFLQSNINLNIPVKYLRTAEKQIIQLARAIMFESKVVILDELTAVLQEKEIKNIFRIIKILKEKGIGIIYISHRLNEVFEICDSYTVLCDGRHISSGNVKDVDKNKLISMIIGRELTQVYPHIENTQSELLLEVKGLTSHNNTFKNINLELHKGEVVGIAGLVGAGKTELLNAIFGNHKIKSGEIWIKGKKVNIRCPQDAIKYKIALVPDERKQLGLNMIYNIKENMVLPSLNRFIRLGVFSDHKKEMLAAYEFCEKLKVAYASLWQGVSKLSGGNQQKIVIAKWMLADSEIFLLDEPTRGIDIGAKVEIYKLIDELTKQGKGVIIVSPELEEIIGLSNKVYIMFEGEIKDVIYGENKTQSAIINSMLGVD
ncbi:MAG: ribose transport system ATP-binding protein [Petrotoga sp.]|jgi:ABC-type sugar transport system ATPase subunit|nr:ribose transport system ATP-binding protein [Petrotoga sp.]